MSSLFETAHTLYGKKGVASLSWRRELRCDIEYQARIESWRDSHHHHNPHHHNNNNNNIYLHVKFN